MSIIDENTVVISSNLELREVLQGDNNYNCVYLDSDIILDGGIAINSNKGKVVIDGTYNSIRHTLIGFNSSSVDDSITACISNKEIYVKNINLEYTNPNGVIYVPLDLKAKDVMVIYDNVIFNGTELSYNPYGIIKIIDSTINIKSINGTVAEEVCEAAYVIIGGNTIIESSATSSPMFLFRSDISDPSVVFLCKSNVILTTDTKEFMNGTNKLNFTILHDASVHLVTGNGFAAYTIHGANNVLIGERASFVFIEKSHQRIPMWSIFGSLTLEEGSVLHVINSYNSTPSDNYNIHFKGSNPSMILNNPKEVVLYTKNANCIYTNNSLNFKIKGKMVNMWDVSLDLSDAGGVNNLPSFSWLKSSSFFEIEGVITSSSTTVLSHNFTDDELSDLPSLDNFSFQNRKQFSIGYNVINIHPLSNVSDVISGHTVSLASVLISYNDVSVVVDADYDGYFEYSLSDKIGDNTTFDIVSSIDGSFIYGKRRVTSPYNGELSLLYATDVTLFDLNIISSSPLLLSRDRELVLKVVDSRVDSTGFKVYACIGGPLMSMSGFVLNDALVFKDFSDNIILLSDKDSLVYAKDSDTGNNYMNVITWSKEKGVLLDLSNCFLEINEEYFAKVHFKIL